MKKIKYFWQRINSYQKSQFLIFLTWGSYFSWLFPWVLFRSPLGNISTTNANAWADWPAHLTLAMPFAYGKISDWFSSHPFFWEKKFCYPFLVDAFSGLLIRFGLDETWSFWLPSLFFMLFLLWVLHKISFYYSQSIGQTFLIVTIFLASGGMGFWFFLKDYNINHQALFFPPREYTHLNEKGIYWINPIISEFIPQRAFPLGMALSLLIIFSWVKWLKRGFNRIKKKQLIFFGFIAGLMPIIHTHSFLVLFFSGILLFFLNFSYWKNWAWVFGGVLISFLPIYFWFYFGQIEKSFFSWQLGWLANEASFFGNWVYFWFLNWGIFLPLTFFSAWKIGFLKEPFFLLGIFLFILCNLFSFQPWAWDNSKILTFSYFFLSLPIGIYLGKQFRKKILSILFATILIECLVFSGGLDLYRSLRTDKLEFLIWTREELLLVENFKKIADADDWVLLSDKHNHPIHSLSGTKALMAYRGWLWSYGIDYANLEKDMKKMFSGKEDAQKLLKKYQIKFVVIGDFEKQEWSANEEYFSKKYPMVLNQAGYKIFKIN